MAFGSKADSIESLKDTIKKSSGGGLYIQSVKAGKDLRVRFLTQPNEWLKYKEHYSEATRFFPCTNDANCPGCQSANEKLKRTSVRFVCNCLDVSQGRVIPLKLPLDLANRLITRYERNGNEMTNRDYTLLRTGSGLDTEYDVEQEDKSNVDVSRYADQFHDLEALLVQQFEEAFGAGVRQAVTSVNSGPVTVTPAPGVAANGWSEEPSF